MIVEKPNRFISYAIILGLIIGIIIGIDLSTYYFGVYYRGIPMNDPKLIYDVLNSESTCKPITVHFTLVPPPNYRPYLVAEDMDYPEFFITQLHNQNMFSSRLDTVTAYDMCYNRTYRMVWGATTGSTDTCNISSDHDIVAVYFRPTELNYTLYKDGNVTFSNGTVDPTTTYDGFTIHFENEAPGGYGVNPASIDNKTNTFVSSYQPNVTFHLNGSSVDNLTINKSYVCVTDEQQGDYNVSVSTCLDSYCSISKYLTIGNGSEMGWYNL